MQFILKYDSALQALGQAIGNLQQYEELPDIDKLSIHDDEGSFELLAEIIPLAKDYRTSCTHHCYYNTAFIRNIVRLIATKNIEIIQELDLVHEKVNQAYLKVGYKGFDNIYEAEKEQQDFASIVKNKIPETECRLH